MTIGAYVKGQMGWFVSTISLFVIMNLILFTSIPLHKSLGEIFYMNLLMLVVMIAGIGLHYRNIKKAYQSIEKGIKKNEEIGYLFEKESPVIGFNLMKQLIAYQDKKFWQTEMRYQQKMNDLKDYMTQSVHNLKVNLAVCEMVTHRLKNEDDTGSKLIFQIEEMKFRINQMLYITRANHYSEDIVSENVALGEVVKAAIHDNAEFFMSKDISIDKNLHAYQLVSDTKWIRYMLTQILNNSSKYTGKGGEVTVFSKEDGKAYYLHIKDNGIGIPEEELSRVFDKGFTGSNGRVSTKSTGMGMYYAKKMADALGIGLDVCSKRGSYTEFILAFYKLSDYLNVTRMSH
jgi:signal transduction histidine kinase